MLCLRSFPQASCVRFLVATTNFANLSRFREITHSKEGIDCVQREIEDLLKAIHIDQRQEQKLVNDVLAAIAVGSAARRRMIQDIANACLQAMEPMSDHVGSPQGHTVQNRVAATERELTDALQSMLREAESRAGAAH